MPAISSSAAWFQFALPRGERPRPRRFHPDTVEFQFALPRGERPGDAHLTGPLVLFQFALPRGERHKIVAVLAAEGRFQFALPRGERPCSGKSHHHHPSFNSRSRVGSDVQMPRLEPAITVSIRAPAWGATFVSSAVVIGGDVSIRAPAWGATWLRS